MFFLSKKEGKTLGKKRYERIKKCDFGVWHIAKQFNCLPSFFVFFGFFQRQQDKRKILKNFFKAFLLKFFSIVIIFIWFLAEKLIRTCRLGSEFFGQASCYNYA